MLNRRRARKPIRLRERLRACAGLVCQSSLGISLDFFSSVSCWRTLGTSSRWTGPAQRSV